MYVRIATLLTLLLVAACAPATIVPTAQDELGHTSREIVDDPPLSMFTLLGDVKLHADPTQKSACLELLQGGDGVIRFRSIGGWAKVMDRRTRQLGWVENRMLTPDNPADNTRRPTGQGSISETF